MPIWLGQKPRGSIALGSLGTGGTWFNAPAYADAAAVADFNNDRYAITTVAVGSVAGATAADLRVKRACTFAEFFAFTASSTTARTYVDALGTLRNDLAVDQPRADWSLGKRQLALSSDATNLFLNSATGATQNITVTAQAYALSFTGTGSITLSGASTGTLSGTGVANRVQTTFTPSAGTLTLTIAGNVRLVQFEAGSVATDYIPTAGASLTRAIETARLSPVLEAILQRTSYGAAARGQNLLKGGGRIVGCLGGGPIIRSGSSRLAVLTDEPTQLVTGNGSDTRTNTWAAAAGFNSSGRSIVRNGTSVATDTTVAVLVRSVAYLGRDGAAGIYGDGRYNSLLIFPERPSDARLAELVA